MLDGAGGRANQRDPLHGTPYSTVRQLRRGGMCEVFEVQSARGERLAAKILLRQHAASAQLRDRMRLEAALLQHVTLHDHLVRGHDFLETADGRPAIIMELLRGNTLHDEVTQRGALPVPEALAWALHGLRGLESLHALGMVHRDVKPSNLFLCRQRGRPVGVKLIDYGYAKPQRPDAPVERVRPSTVDFVGTHRYSAPEQADRRTAKLIDHRADLYSLALVLYTMLRGKEPYAHLKPGKRLLAAQAEQTLEPPSPPTLERLSTTLWEILRIPLAKEPARRFATATAFIRALEHLEGDRLMTVDHCGGNDLPLTAKQHAQMAAELELYPDDADAIRARFGVAAAAAWGRAQEQWRRTIASNLKLKRKWEEEVERHRQHLANATASECDTWGSHASVP